jgi:predicted acyltransferase
LRAAQSLRAQRLGAMRFASVIAIAVAWAWSYWLPFNKNLWTPSFAVWTAGWATLTLLAFHHTIDLKQWPAWGRRFGVNAIAAYAGSELMQILLPALGWQEPLYRHLFADWITPQAGPYAASLAFALGSVALWWLIVLAMDKRHIYIRL